MKNILPPHPYALNDGENFQDLTAFFNNNKSNKISINNKISKNSKSNTSIKGNKNIINKEIKLINI